MVSGRETTGNSRGKSRTRRRRRIAKGGLAVLMILALTGCGVNEEPMGERPELGKIGSVGHRNRTEEETPKGSEGQASQEIEERDGVPLEDTEAGDGEDALHLGQIAAVEGEGEKVPELTFCEVEGDEDFPRETADQIARINHGEQLWEVIGSDYLKDYYALTGMHMITARNQDGSQESVGAGMLTLYVPNLLEGLEDVSVLFYDKTAGKWCLIPAEQVNTEKKTVSMILTGSGALTVVYRKQEEREE